MNGDILTSLAGDIDLSLNQFLAQKSLNEARAAGILDNAIEIELDEDDPSQGGCATGLPAGYYNGSAGTFFARGKKVVQISSTVIIPCARRCSQNKQLNMSVDLMTINYIGQKVVVSVSLDELARNPELVIADLVAKGFGVTTSVHSRVYLERFIHACMKMALPMYLVAESMGMVEGEAAFLHGDMPLARGISGFDYLVPQKSAFSGIRPSGSLAGWKVVIKDNVHGWPQLFALSSSLASTLLGMAGMDVALFHFYGGSTTGKTVVLQVGMSVHAHGGEPGSHPDVAILRWNTTDNALELSLSEFSGLVACIDELGAYNDRKFSSLLYNITSGRAKVRLDKSVRRRKPVLWKMNILSSGEMSIPEKLASHNEQLQGGQEHRAISLNILPEDAAKEGETVVEVRRRADTLKAELAEQYGTAGKAFIARFLSQQNDDDSLMSYSELSEQIKATTEECCQILSEELQSDGYVLSDIQHRALKRFALCLAAGGMAAEWDILPFEPQMIKDSVMSAVRRWLDDGLNQYNPVKEALSAIQLDLIKRQAAHFIPLQDENAYTPSNHWGYIHNTSQDLMIFAPVFDDWCRRHNCKSAEVAKILVAKNYLEPESKGHYKKRVKNSRVEGVFYQIRRAFLNCNISAEF
ncbi:DUF927 domain-containing protein [Enterobacter hormaechei subsp. xiangfangensis]|uniref:DUF927 domain-containing protein n=1 Tax=Enterobacter hormaechei TaxID=158836 RepID=UPI001E2E088A|nr:DUF927 domain-containing protein [Enterobacter hormaechei]MCC4522853.1 DUF927 domain-containing protein [Enterobacter hormaechei]MCC4544525.1 DUF927 domain-containing protein [Enterobacter hormaechei]MCC4549711.1 DUF927 domain-containing protein [Enterobacter hormaechei]HCJ6301588.1 DUF927 domain-containing protein [Enterobacter hormaechei subsp. xiangfangensis]